MVSQLYRGLPRWHCIGCCPGFTFGGEVTLLGVIIDKLRPIHTELGDRDYILALKAYPERLLVYCTGDLIQENGKLVLKNPRQFSLEDYK
jgi:hypothetical protein